MSVKVRRYRRGGWEVDISFRLPQGRRHRERCRAPVSSKSGALRWGEDRERHLLQHGLDPSKKEVPSVVEFWPRFMEGHARANRQKPSGIAAKEMIGRVYLLPYFGKKKLNAIRNEDLQGLKHELQVKAPKTVNDILTVLNTLLRKAVEREVLDRMPCSVRLLPISKGSTAFHDFDEFEWLVDAARALDPRSQLIVLLGGEAGLRCGEIMALEWADVDLAHRQLCVRHSDWNGHMTTPKGGRLRHVPLTRRLQAALREHRHLRSDRVLCQDNGQPLTRQMVQTKVKRAALNAGVQHVGVHVLRRTFCSHLAMRGAPAKAIQELAGHKDLSMTQRYMHLSPAALGEAIRLLDSPRVSLSRGDILETAADSNGGSAAATT